MKKKECGAATPSNMKSNLAWPNHSNLNAMSQQTQYVVSMLNFNVGPPSETLGPTLHQR